MWVVYGVGWRKEIKPRACQIGRIMKSQEPLYALQEVLKCKSAPTNRHQETK